MAESVLSGSTGTGGNKEKENDEVVQALKEEKKKVKVLRNALKEARKGTDGIEEELKQEKSTNEVLRN
jgi:hypothetical protein